MKFEDLFNYEIKYKDRFAFRIADINILVTIPYPKKRILLSKTFQSFLSKIRSPDIIIYTYYGKIPQINLPEKNFLSGVEKWWKLYQIDENKIAILYPVEYKKRNFSIRLKKVLVNTSKTFIIKSKQFHDFNSVNAILPLPYRIAIFKPSFREATIYINSSISSSLLPNPLEYPLLDILLAELLSLRQGVKFHSCGVVDKGRCYLFLGRVGDGKSTMAKLWQEEAIVLNDDRVPVRKIGNSFLAFATPGFPSPNSRMDSKYTSRGIPLSKIFFLHRNNENKIFRLTGAQALSILLTYSPIVSWDTTVFKQTINFFAQLIRAIPCYSLHFTPDKQVLELVRKAK